MLMNANIKEVMLKSARSLYGSLPTIVGAILLIGLVSAAVPKSYYGMLFSRNPVVDSFIGSAVGSVLAGNPVTSYILGGEFLKQGVSLVAVTSFIVAWVTVGVVQYPAEAILLGRKFATYRNISAFFLAIVVAVITVAVVSIL
ncbi:MAG: permease [Nanoarchaeota archaeon]|nr:permease [Nanoarchaeota archaeon]